MLVFSLSGKTPVCILRLKICTPGLKILTAIHIRSLELIPSKSVLALVSKDCMVVITTTGDTCPNSRFGRFQLRGTKSSGLIANTVYTD